ncbi:MAG TPA: hypothetical protein DDX99_03745 [Desulfofustis sp.]|jgi:hypothetical protein|nr:hypothetical protein [Desulfofustis sp.]HBH32214.1 hypothetical protein [Desulfofustis sp.]
MEDAMKTITKTTTHNKTTLERDISSVLLTVVSASAVIAGIWGAACLLSGLVNNGVMGLVRGYITAITGH